VRILVVSISVDIVSDISQSYIVIQCYIELNKLENQTRNQSSSNAVDLYLGVSDSGISDGLLLFRVRFLKVLSVSRQIL
jgi:hypothetical protein